MKKKVNSGGTRSAFVRSINEEARTLEAVASTGAVDSYGTILRCTPEAVDLRRFNRNPVLLAFHDDHSFPVGQCLNMRVEGGELIFTAKFDDITEMDRAVWEKYKARTMRGFSVRFETTEQQTIEVNGRAVTEYTKWELFETSCVPIPANPEALRRSVGARGNMALKRSVKRSEMMKGLKAIGEGDGSDEEKKSAAELYKSMGGDDACKAAEEAEAKAKDAEPDGDEAPEGKEKAAEDEPKAKPEEKKDEEEKSARAAVKVRATTSGERESALALQVRKLVEDAAAEKQTRAVSELVEANLDKIPPALVSWARSTDLATLRGYLKSAPKHSIRAAVPEAGARGDGQGTGDASVPPLSMEESRKLDKILGINTDVAKVGFGAFDATRGAMTFSTPTASQIRAAQAPRGKEG